MFVVATLVLPVPAKVTAVFCEDCPIPAGKYTAVRVKFPEESKENIWLSPVGYVLKVNVVLGLPPVILIVCAAPPNMLDGESVTVSL
jgi:hypothetical protein